MRTIPRLVLGFTMAAVMTTASAQGTATVIHASSVIDGRGKVLRDVDITVE